MKKKLLSLNFFKLSISKIMKKLKKVLIFITIAFMCLAIACTQVGTAVTTPNYFDNTEKGVKTGGVKVIEIETPKGKFKVWTKTIGNNPKMRLLLLNGGPGATHEYFECFESFLPKEGIEFIYYEKVKKKICKMQAKLILIKIRSYHTKERIKANIRNFSVIIFVFFSGLVLVKVFLLS